jgi:hypothetical protein
MSKWDNSKKTAGATKTEYKPKSVTVLDIRVVETKNGKKPKIQFGKDVEIYYQGNKLDLGEYNSGFLKTKEELVSDLEFRVEKEWLTEEKAQAEVDYLDTKSITSKFIVALK